MTRGVSFFAMCLLMQCFALLTGNYHYTIKMFFFLPIQKNLKIHSKIYSQWGCAAISCIAMSCSQATLSRAHRNSAGAGQTKNDQHPYTGVFLELYLYPPKLSWKLLSTLFTSRTSTAWPRRPLKL